MNAVTLLLGDPAQVRKALAGALAAVLAALVPLLSTGVGLDDWRLYVSAAVSAVVGYLGTFYAPRNAPPSGVETP